MLASAIMTNVPWPPSFTLDQESILNLLTGDRFYSNPSAALREAVLNAIDAVQRRRRTASDLAPNITVTFNHDDLTVAVADNGIGMNCDDVRALFTKVGASAATAEVKKESVGEFGIGVISYFMAGDTFDLQTNDGSSEPIGLSFSMSMLTGGGAAEITPTQDSQGTNVTLRVRDAKTLELLLEKFPYWCRDVDGLSGRLLPNNETLNQGGSHRPGHSVEVDSPGWVERSHLSPIADPTGWDAMTRGFYRRCALSGCVRPGIPGE